MEELLPNDYNYERQINLATAAIANFIQVKITSMYILLGLIVERLNQKLF